MMKENVRMVGEQIELSNPSGVAVGGAGERKQWSALILHPVPVRYRGTHNNLTT